MAGVVGVGCCCLRLAERLTEACGPGMPGPYGELKEIGTPPPFDKGGRGVVCNIIELKLVSTTDTLHENAGRFFIANLPKTVALALA